MKNKLLIILISALVNAILLNGAEKLMANGSIYIYGTVTTIDNEQYTGQIRWGKEEAFWFDMFNSSKRKNENLKLLSDRELSDLDRKDHHNNNKWGKWNNWNWNWGNDSHSHSFACEFGHIKSLKLTRGDRVVLELKNGDAFVLEGGSNDIGADIQVVDVELGLVRLDWDRVQNVEFASASQRMESYFGEPLYGTVHTEEGDFTGYLQWDHDERLGHDELNGDYEDGELDIRFDKISKIEKIFRGSEVTLKSGRSFKLSGSNDVNSDNRGIIVNVPNYGRVDIDWDEFESIEFVEAPTAKGISYNDFNGETELKAKVVTITGDELEGKIIYDLDEEYNLEILNGKENDLEYFFPFYTVKSITPKNDDVSVVELRNGSTFYLEGKVDVNEGNDGIIVFLSKDDYTYIPWDEVEKIIF